MFDTLINSLQRNDTLDNKMHRMKVAIGATGMISTSQVAELLKFLPSDSAKLELAKTAHGYLSDHNSYGNVINQDSYGGTIGEAFSSSSAKARLDEYIHRRY